MKTIFHVLREASRLGIRRRHGFILVTLQLAASIFELLGFVSFVPVLQFLMVQGDVLRLAADSPHWKSIQEFCQVAGLEITLPMLLIVTFGLFAARQVLTLVRDLYDSTTRENEMTRIRAEIFDQYLRANSDYQDGAALGSLVADVNLNTLRAVYHIFSRFGLATQIILFGVYVVGMIAINAAMTGLLLLVVVIGGLTALPQLLKSRQVGRDFVAAGNSISDYLLERIKLVRLVRLSRMEDAESGEFRMLSARWRDVSVRSWRLNTAVDKLLETIALLSGLVIIFVATTYFGVGVEIVGLFLTMLLRLMPVVRQVASTKQAIDNYRASYDAIVLRREASAGQVELSGGTRCFQSLVDSIRFDGVSYAYKSRPDAPVLRGVTASFPARKMTAIVGPSGSGKSTLVDLLPRLRVPDHGRITIDDVDIREFELQLLRKGIAYLSQTPLVFNVPLGEHISYGAPEANQLDIERAARLAGAHDFITALPEGYATKAGEGGKALSGGQRQRLDLARALLSGAPILILDEPTANLDAQSERAFREALDRIRRETDTTIIVVAHRLSTVQTADQIIVLEAGRVTGAGSHAELLRDNVWYRTSFGQPEPLIAAQ